MKRQASTPSAYSSTTSYVEDIVSVCPLDLDDVGLPAYEESVDSALDEFRTGSDGEGTRTSIDTYRTQGERGLLLNSHIAINSLSVSNTARFRLNEKDHLKRNLLAPTQDKSPISPSGASFDGSSVSTYLI